MRRLLAALVALAASAFASPAFASADSTCYPEWKLIQTDYKGCSGTALLSPGNDTRINLLMLLADRHGAVGPASRYGYVYSERRGEAEPFAWMTFAHALGPSPKGAEDDETGNFPFGTRCMSNMTGSAEFIDAVARAKGLSGEERAMLTAVRIGLNPQCTDARSLGATRDSLASIKSKAGRGFADYLIGAAAFYDGNFDEARECFTLTSKPDSRWLAEATRYMIARSLLNQAMQGAFDEYGGLIEPNPNSELLDASESAFGDYLKAYPGGRYAASARGLLRRVYWLMGDRGRMASAYAALFRQPLEKGGSFPDLVQEIDIKLLDKLTPEMVLDPLILAVLDLRAMRRADDPKLAEYGSPPIARAALDAQRQRFAGNEALFAYLQAVHALYIAKQPQEVLRLIPEGTGDSYFEFSRQLLRAAALDATGDKAARSALLGLVAAARKPHQRGSAELALAMHDERAKAVERVFAADSVIRDPDIREILLRYHAGPSLLLREAAGRDNDRETQVALFTLLYKRITRGFYADFVRDLALLPADARGRAPDDYVRPIFTDATLFRWTGAKEFACPSLTQVAATLSTRPKDAQAMLCLGEFIRTQGLDPDYYGVTRYLDELPKPDELGGTPSQFPGKRFSRLAAYRAIMADRTATPDQRAYALYRAVNCYAPAGFNGCDESEDSQAQRKAWFEQLKRQYPASAWAKKLRYYW
jgi:hypothetical protein